MARPRPCKGGYTRHRPSAGSKIDVMRLVHGLVILGILIVPARAQTPPSAAELAAYQGLHLLAARGDLAATRQALAAGAKPNVTDAHQRSPLHIAAHFGHGEIARV